MSISLHAQAQYEIVTYRGQAVMSSLGSKGTYWRVPSGIYSIWNEYLYPNIIDLN